MYSWFVSGTPLVTSCLEFKKCLSVVCKVLGSISSITCTGSGTHTHAHSHTCTLRHSHHTHTHAHSHTHTLRHSHHTHLCAYTHMHTHNLRVSHASSRVSPVDPWGREGATIFLCGVLHRFPPFLWIPHRVLDPAADCSEGIRSCCSLMAVSGPKMETGQSCNAPSPSVLLSELSSLV